MESVPFAALHRLPKVDLHRHLEGSLRLDSLVEIARAEGLDLPTERGALAGRVQVGPGDPTTAQAFLGKFETLRHFYRSGEIIQRLTREAVLDAAQDGVRYLELRFNPGALASARKFPLEEVVDWVCRAASDEARASGVRVGLIVSVNRHEPVEVARGAARVAMDRMQEGIVGLDLAGKEWQFDAGPFREIFSEAKHAGLGVTVHAGEWAGAEAVRRALDVMGADRVGHGVRVMEDPSVVARARERGLVFEVCVRSNVQSGVVPSVDAHPLPRMIEAGLRVTLNTDDPQVSGTTLSDEYALACNEFAISTTTLQGMILTAAQASFLPAGEKKALEAGLVAELFGGG
jgi:adenosine deaminase